MSVPTQPFDLTALRALGCELVPPGDDGFDAARTGFLANVPADAGLVAFPADAGQVAGVLRAARAAGVRVAPQRTGHGCAPRRALAGGVLLRTDRLGGVEIDADRRIARVGAAALWADVCAAAQEHGLWPLAGSAPSVGVVGYCLGGGLSFLARTKGLACHGVRAVEFVSAAGELVRADETEHRELLWAARGGTVPGIVTALELELHEVGEITCGALFYPAERTGEVLRAWDGLLDGFPDELATIGRFLKFPPLPDVPEPLRGRAMCLIEVVFQGAADALEPHLAPLRALGPELDTVAATPVQALAMLHMDPPGPVPAVSGAHLLTGALDDAAWDEIAAAAGLDNALLGFELRHLGGALARPVHGAALRALPGRFATFGVGVAATPEQGAAVLAAADRIAARLEPARVGAYRNFDDRPGTPERFHDGATVARLRALLAEWDPDGTIVAHHDLVAAG